MSRLTSSMLERAHECLASTVLPQTPHSGVEAEHGNENHANAENESKLPDSVREFLSTLHDTRKEISFVLDTSKRTVQQTGTHRGYGYLTQWQIGTTPDVVGFDGDVPTSLDFKSRKRVTSASRNWQIRSQALAISLFGSRVRAGIAYLNDGHIDIAEFGPIELNAAWADMRELCADVEKIQLLRKELPTAQLTPKRGEWCRHCPAFLSCPAQRLAMVSLRNSPDVSALVANATDEEIEDARLARKALEETIKQFDEAVRIRAEIQPITLRNGKVLKLIECKRQSDDVYQIKEALRAHGTDPEKFKRTITYTQLKECNK